MPEAHVMVTRLVLAGVLGALIGAEREYRAKVAGTRTHLLVAVGAALMVIVSRWGFGGQGDPGRVAAQIVSGIGFIGAGAIMVNKHAVHGLTTAAGIWVAAGIGMAVACGLYALAVSSAAISLIGLEVLGWFFRNKRRLLAELDGEEGDKALRPVSTEVLVPNVQRRPASVPGAFRIVLASGSPRRAKILEAAGVDFTVLKTDAQETSIPDDPEGTVKANAVAKLEAARRELAQNPPATPCGGVLAADTIVWLDGRIYGKPRDLAEAAAFLRELSGRTHAVFTCVAFAGADGAVRTSVVRSDVTFRVLDEAAISSYLDKVKPLDRAGAYDIDDSGGVLVASHTGSYENIMGLPLEPLAEFGVIDRL